MGFSAFLGPSMGGAALGGVGNAFEAVFGQIGESFKRAGIGQKFKDIFSPSIPEFPGQPPVPPDALKEPLPNFQVQAPTGLLESQKQAATLGTSQLLYPLDYVSAP